MHIVTTNSIQSWLSIFTYIFSVDAHRHLRDRTYSRFAKRKVGVKEITKLVRGHTANKPKNQDQRPLPPNSYKTKQQQQL